MPKAAKIHDDEAIERTLAALRAKRAERKKTPAIKMEEVMDPATSYDPPSKAPKKPTVDTVAPEVPPVENTVGKSEAKDTPLEIAEKPHKKEKWDKLYKRLDEIEGLVKSKESEKSENPEKPVAVIKTPKKQKKVILMEESDSESEVVVVKKKSKAPKSALEIQKPDPDSYTPPPRINNAYIRQLLGF